MRRVVAPAGPDSTSTSRRLQPYLDAGFDEIYVAQIGGRFEGFFRTYADDVLPELKRRSGDR